MKPTEKEITNWLRKPPFVLNLFDRKHTCQYCGVEFVDGCGNTKYCEGCRKLTKPAQIKKTRRKFYLRSKAGAPKRVYRGKEKNDQETS